MQVEGASRSRGVRVEGASRSRGSVSRGSAS